MKKILITGGTGFIGLHLVEALTRKGFACRCLVRDNSKIAHLEKFNPEFVYGDITDKSSIRGIAEGVETVYHLAALGHVSAISDEAYDNFVRVNVGGTANLIEECRKHAVDRFIHFSSTAAMGLIKSADPVDERTVCQPSTPYQKSKLESERVVLSLCRDGLQGIVLRPCMVYGPGGGGEFLKLCKLIKKGIFPKVGKGKNLTPMVHVKDLVQGAIQAGMVGNGGNVYLVTSPLSIEMEELRRSVLLSLGIKRPAIYIPIWMGKCAAVCFESAARLTGTTPIMTYKNMESLITNRVFSIDKAKRELGYAPCIPFDEGISSTLAWYVGQGLI